MGPWGKLPSLKLTGSAWKWWFLIGISISRGLFCRCEGCNGWKPETLGNLGPFRWDFEKQKQMVIQPWRTNGWNPNIPVWTDVFFNNRWCLFLVPVLHFPVCVEKNNPPMVACIYNPTTMDISTHNLNTHTHTHIQVRWGEISQDLTES